MRRNGSQDVIVALVDEDGELDHVWEAGMDAARARPAARLILYDASSASVLTEPIASAVSADGVGEQYGSLLSPDDLDALGRSQIARRVRVARDRGIDTWGRLASDHGMEALMGFAREQHADLVVIPDASGEQSVIDQLRGDTLEDAEEAATVPLQIVSTTARRRRAGGTDPPRDP